MPDELIPEMATSPVGDKIDIVLPRVVAIDQIYGPDEKKLFYLIVHLTPPMESGQAVVGVTSMQIRFNTIGEAERARIQLIKAVNQYHMGNVAYAVKKQTDAIREASDEGLGRILLGPE